MEAHAIDTKTLDKRLSGSKKMKLLDVRRKMDYEASPDIIPGALWRDPENTDRWINELPAGQPIVVYCVKGGSVSQSVTDQLRKEGHNALFLKGGLKAWREAGKAVEPNRP